MQVFPIINQNIFPILDKFKNRWNQIFLSQGLEVGFIGGQASQSQQDDRALSRIANGGDDIGDMGVVEGEEGLDYA